MNKKGDVSFLKKMILALVITIILISFATSLAKSTDKAASVQKCKTWVALESAPIIGKVAGVKSFRVLEEESPCETFDVTIKEKHDTYEVLAEEMYSCWDMYLGGKQDWYSDWDTGALSSTNYCLVCSEVRFTKEAARANNNRLDMGDFWLYLSTHNIPYKSITYTEHFLGTDTASINTDDFANEGFDISGEKPLFVTFHITKMNKGVAAQITSGAVPAGLSAIAVAKVLGVSAFLGPVGWGVAAVGLVGASIYYFVDDAYIVPSILIFENDPEKVQTICDEVYYEPRENLYEKYISGGVNV
jgi:hypothetical protein